jgi:hypothetical protein
MILSKVPGLHLFKEFWQQIVHFHPECKYAQMVFTLLLLSGQLFWSRLILPVSRKLLYPIPQTLSIPTVIQPKVVSSATQPNTVFELMEPVRYPILFLINFLYRRYNHNNSSCRPNSWSAKSNIFQFLVLHTFLLKILSSTFGILKPLQ